MPMNLPSLRRVGQIAFTLGLTLTAASAAPGVLTAQSAQPGRATWGLFSLRVDTRTSDFIYAVYGYGNSFAMMGVLHNPRSGYGEVLGAVGRRFTLGGGPTQFTAIAIAHATESWYAQVYYLPAVHLAPLWLRTTAELYLPLQRAGVVQFDLSPATATVVIAHRFEAGLALDLATAQHAALSTALGPEVRVPLPNGVIGADLEKLLDGSGGRLRLFFINSF